MIPELSIFVSSPGDVAQERAVAEGVLGRLQGEFGSRVRLQPIFWEHEPLRATASFQEQIVRPSETDIVVCILWSRLGTRLPARFTREDGTRYASGTEYEFEDAVAGYRENGRPDLLVYRKTAEPMVSLVDSEALMDKLAQRQALDAFVTRWFHDREDGSLRAAYHQFETLEEFEGTLERHLRRLVEQRVPPAAEASEGPPAAPARWTEGSPFRGLEPFDEAHAEVFFGRTRAVSEVLDHLRAQEARGRPFVVVVGMSGGGKSSLVRAGLVPLLTRPGVVEGVPQWRRAVLRPADEGGDPFLALAVSLASPGALPEIEAAGTSIAELAELASGSPGAIAPLVRAALDRVDGRSGVQGTRLVLVVDQLEELFSIRSLSEGERRAFGRLLEALTRSGRVWIVATLRSDLYPRLAEVPELVALKEGEGQYDLLAPSASEIGQMIRQPVQAAGLRLDVDPATGERLEDHLLEASIGRPGSLPLLEFTLEELYRQRTDDGRLTLAAFADLGGVLGSLARRAEEVFAALPSEVQGAFQRVMRHLVTVIENAEGTTLASRPAPLERFDGDPAATRLIEALVAARLLVTDLSSDRAGVVRVAHEALLRHWPRLTDWLEADQELLKSRARLRAAAFQWAEAGRNPDLLMSAGKPLEDARSVVGEGTVLSDLERAFVAASERKALRFTRARRLASVALAVFAVAAALSGWTARQARERAEAQAYSATRTHEFMVGLLALARPDLSRGEETTVRDLLDVGRDLLVAGELGDVPATGSWAMRDLASSYLSLGALGDALILARASDSLGSTDPALPDSVLAHAWTLLGEVHTELGNLDSAAIHLERAMTVWEDVSPSLLAHTAATLATVRSEQGRDGDAETLRDMATRLGLEATDSTGLDFAVVLSNEALRHLARGDGVAAERLLRRAEAIWALHPNLRISDYAVLLTHLARARALQGDLRAADSLFRAGLEIERRVLPESHPGLAVTLNNLALNAQERGDTAAAEAWLREALALATEGLGPDHPRTVTSMVNLGEMLTHDPARWREADSLLGGAIEALSRVAPLNEDMAIALVNRAALAEVMDDPGRARRLLDEAFRVDSAAGRHEGAVLTASRLATLERGREGGEGVGSAVERAFGAAARIADERERARTLDDLQDLLFNADLMEPAERAARAALELRLKLDPVDSAPLANSLADVAWWEARAGRADSALALTERAGAMLVAVPIGDSDWIGAHVAVTWALTAVGEVERVVEREDEAARSLVVQGRITDAVLSLFRKATALEQLGRADEARATLLEAQALAREGLGPDHPLVRQAGDQATAVGDLAGG